MSFLVGCILIHHFGLPWWWYAIAGAWYAAEWQVLREHRDELSRRINNVHEFLVDRFGDDYDR